MRLQRLLKLHFQFNPWDAKNTAAREVLRRSAAPSARKTNPECSVTYKMRTDKQPPVVLVQYDTGAEETIVATRLTAQQIIDRIYSTTERIRASHMLKEAGYPDGVYLHSTFGNSANA